MFEAETVAAGNGERLSAFDALRSGAMVVGVLFHASVAYQQAPLGSLLWPVHDPAATPAFDVLFWWTRGIQIPLFFLISGFFAAAAVERRGARAFVSSRVRRLLGPLTLGCVTVLPVLYYVWCWGWVRSQRCTVREVRALKFDDFAIQSGFFGPGHLWFLEDLFVVSIAFAVLCATRAARTRETSQRGAERMGALGSWGAAPGLAVLSAAVLFLDPVAVSGFRNSFVPSPARIGYHALFFVVGVALHCRPEALARLAGRALPLLAASVAAGAVAVPLAMRMAAGQTASVPSRLGFGLAYGVFSWLSVLGFTGLAVRTVRGGRSSSRLLAEASYWVYLVHLPIVGLVQIALAGTSLPSTLKCVVVCGVTLVLSFGTYHLFVRDRALGRWLAGAPSPGKPTGPGLGPSA